MLGQDNTHMDRLRDTIPASYLFLAKDLPVRLLPWEPFRLPGAPVDKRPWPMAALLSNLPDPRA
jgi:hypothetical protein